MVAALDLQGHPCLTVPDLRRIADGENYTVLLNQLKPDKCSCVPLQTGELRACAEQVLQNADLIGCRKYLTPSALIAGSPRLNFTLTANLFNTWPGLPRSTRLKRRTTELLRTSTGSRLGAVQRAMDSKGAELVGNTPKLSRFNCVENTNYTVDIGNMHLVGIQGADIADGRKALVLGLVWQLMRMNITQTLTSLSETSKYGTTSDPTLAQQQRQHQQHQQQHTHARRSTRSPDSSRLALVMKSGKYSLSYKSTHARGVPIALDPLYDPDFGSGSGEGGEARLAQVIARS